MTYQKILQALRLAGMTLLLGACASLSPDAPDATPASTTPAVAPRMPELARYLDALAAMAPGDPARQKATLDAARTAASQDPNARHRLLYALALGSAGHAGSDPIEAKGLITDLLAGDHGLQPLEVELATAFLREFDARVALYAELGRQREESEHQLQSASSEAEQRVEALVAENARLRRSLATAERKLEAVAEMERSLLDQAAEPADKSPSPPQP
jgi:hypothetical protein